MLSFFNKNQANKKYIKIIAIFPTLKPIKQKFQKLIDYSKKKTVMSVLLKITRTSSMYEERKILYTARRRSGEVKHYKILSSLWFSKCLYLFPKKKRI